MSLKDIKLPPNLIAEFYSNHLVQWGPAPTESKRATHDKLSYLGNNQKQITILVNNADAGILPDKSYTFLTGILGACKLNLSDVAVMNLNHVKEKTYQSIVSITNAKTILIFGVELADIGLPLQFPYFQVQKYNNITFLSAPELEILEKDQLLKSKLWICLKTIFLVK